VILGPSQPVILVLSFEGWIVLRLPTDPDPSDEPRGVSGYTFAFAGEPDLDRVLYLQPPANWTPRSGSPSLGVTVRSAVRSDGTACPALVGATVDLLDGPVLENRQWTIALPGYEPIVPFHLQVTAPQLTVRRDIPLDPANPDAPVWEVAPAVIAVQAADGMQYEPQTIGHATGIWDSLRVVADRLAMLKQERQRETDPTKQTALDGRIAELEIAVAPPSTDRRVMARYFVERFAFAMLGPPASITGDQVGTTGGTLDPGSTDPKNAWRIAFWLGAWDPDLLCAYMQGALEIPLTLEPA
jgi:hypothetical protein